MEAVSAREALIAALTAELGDSYDCTRVWAAWDVGTMSEQDFEPLTDRVDEIADALLESVRSTIINTPETTDFMAGVPLEAIHQRERWGAAHDAGKGPLDWFWLIGYLAQKAADAAIRGDTEKAKHHTISTAAALANWHAALTGADTSMRPGIDAKAKGIEP